MSSTRLARAGVVSLAGTSTAAGLAFVLTVVVSRGLGASGTGSFFQVVAIFSMVAQLLKLGADTGLVRTLARLVALNRAVDVRPTLLVALVPVGIVAVIGTLGLWLVAPALGQVLAEPAQRDHLVALLRAVAPFVGFPALLSVLLAGTRGMGSVLPFTVVQNVALPVARLVLVFIAVGWGLGVEGALRGWSVSLPLWTLVAGAVLGWQVRRLVVGQRLARRQLLAREFWSFSGPRAVTAGLEIFLEWVDVLVVAAYLGPTDAGVYAVATRCVRAGQVADQALRVTVGPRVSALLAVSDLPSARSLYDAATRAMILVTWPFYLTLAIMGPALLELFGSEFRAGSGVLAVLAGAMMMAAASGMLQSILLMGGRSSWQLANKALALALSVALNLLLVPRVGIFGAAIAWALVILVDTTLARWQVHRRMQVWPSWASLRLPAALALGVFGLGGLAIRLVLGADLWALGVNLVVLSPIYLRLVWRYRSRLGWDDLRPARHGSEELAPV